MMKIIRYWILLSTLTASMPFAAERCVMTFSDCPENFNNKTILVPDKVVAIAPNVLACSDTAILTDKVTPSFLFIIDNSGSMSSTTDRNGSRFTVTRALLDTLFRMQPATEVGLVVFQEHLFFDIRSTQFYAQYFKAMPVVYDTQPNQAYLPFLTLNQNYNGLTGLQILDSILATNSNNTALRYAPNWNQVGNTNINVAFEAAKDAFLSAKNPKTQQYIVFLSDGEPRGIWQAGQDSMYFTQGLGVPTTFTVFFSSGAAPQSLTTMTQNIAANGYSIKNPISALWTIQTSHAALLTLLMQNVISQINVPAIPVKMVLNNVVSNTYANGSFVFPDSFMIGTSSATQFSMVITYRYTVNGVQKDTTNTTVFSVSHSATATTPPGVTFNCTTYNPPVQSVPVTATVLDTNHEGHIDKIDITWTDTAAIRPTMPSVAELIQSLQLTTLDGTKINLNAATIVADIPNKTIHIILNENTGSVYETGVNTNSSKFTLTNIGMTVSLRPFIVSNIIDGAAPVIKLVCFVPAAFDTLRVTFSEPVNDTNKPGSPNRYFSIVNKSNAAIPDTGKPVLFHGDMLLYVYPSGTLTDAQFVKEGNRGLVPLHLCGDVGIVKSYHVASNPFIPRVTVIPPSQQGGNSTVTTGTRIEVVMIPSVQQALVDGDIKATTSIYDAVGNTILSNVDMAVDLKDPKNPKVFLLWSGITKKGTYAGGGTYVAKTVIVDHKNNNTQIIRQSIGLKQAK
jgi:hypothetical protein